MNICVFSSSSNAIAQVYVEEAKLLGKLIGEQGHTLVNGGANVGLMEIVTLAAANAGARTIGVIPERFVKRSLASGNAHEVITTGDMQERKAKMREISDAFIALPGGFGTLEEILEVLTLRQLDYHKKPVVFVNTNSFFNYLLQQFEHSFDEKFSKEIYRSLYFVAKDAVEALEYIAGYEPPELDSKWFIVPEL
ncbi:MAG: TIGR00730 family Rossman fold protein [Mariniphaga sp.]|nr:TIGR00730 family Rossman fold protein [Mariniphaga sp.]MDD4225690.1 TIGR00730 family Rossman fold protein [Mariniphaga sp.]MDD4425403.1 TIGR00730 family Rossman fold protein [Mariniphaga sp.]